MVSSQVGHQQTVWPFKHFKLLALLQVLAASMSAFVICTHFGTWVVAGHGLLQAVAVSSSASHMHEK